MFAGGGAILLHGVREMTYVVGIDVSSEKHDCCILGDDGTCDSFTFSNSSKGFQELLEKLPDPENTMIGLEATGIYGNNLVDFLRRKGFKTVTFNPLNIKRLAAATTLRKTKTDKTDAKFIARSIAVLDVQPDHNILYHISELKSLSRSRFSVVQDRSRLESQFKSTLMLAFPEFVSFFSDCFGATALAVLEKYICPRNIAKCRTNALAKLMHTVSRGRFGYEDAQKLVQLAKTTVGTHSDAVSIMIPYYISQIRILSKQISLLEKQMGVILAEIDSPITTIPGIGTVLGSMILAEIGDINRFSTPSQLLAFAGLEPSVSESGKSVSSTGKMVKRGSSYLRWAIIQVARNANLHCKVFADYLEKKRMQGKHFNVAVSHLAKKIVRVIFAILQKNVPFDPQFSS